MQANEIGREGYSLRYRAVRQSGNCARYVVIGVFVLALTSILITSLILSNDNEDLALFFILVPIFIVAVVFIRFCVFSKRAAAYETSPGMVQAATGATPRAALNDEPPYVLKNHQVEEVEINNTDSSTQQVDVGGDAMVDAL